MPKIKNIHKRAIFTENGRLEPNEFDNVSDNTAKLFAEREMAVIIPQRKPRKKKEG